MGKKSRDRSVAKSRRSALISLFLVVALLVTGALAFMTATDTKTNTFTVGRVDIELWEKFDDDRDGVVDSSEIYDPEIKNITTERILPNATVQKAPWVVNTGTNDAYIYMKVGIPVSDVLLTEGDGSLKMDSIIRDQNGDLQFLSQATEMFTLLDKDGNPGVNEGWTLIPYDATSNYETAVDEDGQAYHYYVYAYHGTDDGTVEINGENKVIADSETVAPEEITAELFSAVKFANFSNSVPVTDVHKLTLWEDGTLVRGTESHKHNWSGVSYFTGAYRQLSDEPLSTSEVSSMSRYSIYNYNEVSKLQYLSKTLNGMDLISSNLSHEEYLLNKSYIDAAYEVQDAGIQGYYGARNLSRSDILNALVNSSVGNYSLVECDGDPAAAWNSGDYTTITTYDAQTGNSLGTSSKEHFYFDMGGRNWVQGVFEVPFAVKSHADAQTVAQAFGLDTYWGFVYTRGDNAEYYVIDLPAVDMGFLIQYGFTSLDVSPYDTLVSAEDLAAYVADIKERYDNGETITLTEDDYKYMIAADTAVMFCDMDIDSFVFDDFYSGYAFTDNDWLFGETVPGNGSTGTKYGDPSTAFAFNLRNDAVYGHNVNEMLQFINDNDLGFLYRLRNIYEMQREQNPLPETLSYEFNINDNPDVFNITASDIYTNENGGKTLQDWSTQATSMEAGFYDGTYNFRGQNAGLAQLPNGSLDPERAFNRTYSWDIPSVVANSVDGTYAEEYKIPINAYAIQDGIKKYSYVTENETISIDGSDYENDNSVNKVTQRTKEISYNRVGSYVSDMSAGILEDMSWNLAMEPNGTSIGTLTIDSLTPSEDLYVCDIHREFVEDGSGNRIPFDLANAPEGYIFSFIDTNDDNYEMLKFEKRSDGHFWTLNTDPQMIDGVISQYMTYFLLAYRTSDQSVDPDGYLTTEPQAVINLTGADPMGLSVMTQDDEGMQMVVAILGEDPFPCEFPLILNIPSDEMAASLGVGLTQGGLYVYDCPTADNGSVYLSYAGFDDYAGNPIVVATEEYTWVRVDDYLTNDEWATFNWVDTYYYNNKYSFNGGDIKAVNSRVNGEYMDIVYNIPSNASTDDLEAPQLSEGLWIKCGTGITAEYEYVKSVTHKTAEDLTPEQVWTNLLANYPWDD